MPEWNDLCANDFVISIRPWTLLKHQAKVHEWESERALCLNLLLHNSRRVEL
jgi:hypothetical protein